MILDAIVGRVTMKFLASDVSTAITLLKLVQSSLTAVICKDTRLKILKIVDFVKCYTIDILDMVKGIEYFQSNIEQLKSCDIVNVVK